MDDPHRYGISRGSRNRWLFMAMLILLAGLFLLDLSVGSVSLSLQDIFSAILGRPHEEVNLRILYDFRLPKAITAILAGVALSVSGLMMQTMFRNPLAGPYVLGISSGAGLGVAILVMGWPAFSQTIAVPGHWSILLAAVSGAVAVMILVLLVSFWVRDVLTLLIMGMLFGSALSAIISILQYFSSESSLRSFVVWTMGSLGGVTVSQMKVMLPPMAIGIVMSFLSVKMLNGLLLGEQGARSLGVNLTLARVMVILATGILAGTVTGFCGPIGFVGVAIPHITRLIFRTSDHRVLLPGVMLTGPVLVLVSDLISQSPPSGIILPINSVTALLGIPVILWIIIRRSSVEGFQ